MMICASSTSPEATPAGTSTVTLVTAVLESNNGPAFTNEIPVTGVAVAVGAIVWVGVGVTGTGVGVGVAVTIGGGVAVAVGVAGAPCGTSRTACPVIPGNPPLPIALAV